MTNSHQIGENLANTKTTEWILLRLSNQMCQKSLKDENCLRDIFPCNICPVDISGWAPSLNEPLCVSSDNCAFL